MIIQKCRQVNRFFPPPKKFTFFSPAFTCHHASTLPGPRRTGACTFRPRSPADARELYRGRAARAAELFARVRPPTRGGFAGAAPRGRPNFCPPLTRRHTGISLPAAVDGGGGVCYNIYIMKKQKSRAPYQRAYGPTPRAAYGAERRRDAAARTTHSTQR